MLETIASLATMGIATLFVGIAGYVIITGENEEARKKNDQNTQAQTRKA